MSPSNTPIFQRLANAHSTVEQRLARWLCMCHDRAESNEFSMTHEFLSLMLAVRRSSITDAIHVLEGNRTIRSSRARVMMLNRARLEEAAKDAYGVPEREYERLIAPLRQHPEANRREQAPPIVGAQPRRTLQGDRNR